MKVNTLEPQKIASITIRNNINLLQITTNYAAGIAKGLGMSDEKVELIRLHAENILRRRIINAYEEIGEITLDILVDMENLTLEVTDKGVPYWVDVEQELETLKYHADSYKVKKLGTEGQCFCMTFKLEDDIDVMKYKKQEGIHEEMKDANLHIRRVVADENDIIEVLKCIHSNYGYGYLNHAAYDLDHMKAILSDGSQWSYLGYNDHDQIVAHASLAFHEDFPNVPELGGLICKEFCRGHNIANRLTAAVSKAGEKEGVNGIFGMPVAFHPYSQKITLKEGFVPTGIMLHYVTPESTGAYIDGDRRQECCICAKLFTGKTYKISAPEKHRAFIKDLYVKMGCDCEFVEPQELSGQSDMRMTMVNDIAMGQIFIENAAPDMDDEIKAMMKSFTSNKIAMVEVYINMNNPSAASAYKVMEDNGYFFSGIMPGSDNGEYMIMQHIMGNPVEWDKIVTTGAFTDIMEYVKRNKGE